MLLVYVDCCLLTELLGGTGDAIISHADPRVGLFCKFRLADLCLLARAICEPQRPSNEDIALSRQVGAPVERLVRRPEAL